MSCCIPLISLSLEGVFGSTWRLLETIDGAPVMPPPWEMIVGAPVVTLPPNPERTEIASCWNFCTFMIDMAYIMMKNATSRVIMSAYVSSQRSSAPWPSPPPWPLPFLPFACHGTPFIPVWELRRQ